MRKIFAALVAGVLTGTVTDVNFKKLINGKVKRISLRLKYQCQQGEPENDDTVTQLDFTLVTPGNKETGAEYVFTAKATNAKEGKNKRTGELIVTTTSFEGGTFKFVEEGAQATSETVKPALNEDTFNQALTANNGKLEGKVINKWPEDFANAQRNQVPLSVKLSGPNGEDLGEITLPKVEKGVEAGTLTSQTEKVEFTFTIVDGANVNYTATANVAAGLN